MYFFIFVNGNRRGEQLCTEVGETLLEVTAHNLKRIVFSLCSLVHLSNGNDFWRRLRHRLRRDQAMRQCHHFSLLGPWHHAHKITGTYHPYAGAVRAAESQCPFSFWVRFPHLVKQSAVRAVLTCSLSWVFFSLWTFPAAGPCRSQMRDTEEVPPTFEIYPSKVFEDKLFFFLPNLATVTWFAFTISQ